MGYDQRYMVKQWTGVIRNRFGRLFVVYNTGDSRYALFRPAVPLPPWDKKPWPRTDVPPPFYEIAGMDFAIERKRVKRGVLPPSRPR